MLALAILVPLLLYLPYDDGPGLYDTRRCAVCMTVGAVLWAAGLALYGTGLALARKGGLRRVHSWFWLVNGWTVGYLPFCALSHLMQGLHLAKPYFLLDWSGGRVAFCCWLGLGLTSSLCHAVRLRK